MEATATVASPADLTDESIARFHQLGFMIITDLTTPEDLDDVARLLAGLYRRFRELMDARRAHDLGSERNDARPILEINQTVDLEPRLAETLTFRRCSALAERLLGQPVEHRFDHAIYKPPFNGAATSWHQDEAYALERRIRSAHFWVPLQDVTRDMGCMEFIPGSHRGALGRHHRLDRLRDAHALELVGLDTSQAGLVANHRNPSAARTDHDGAVRDERGNRRELDQFAWLRRSNDSTPTAGIRRDRPSASDGQGARRALLIGRSDELGGRREGGVVMIDDGLGEHHGDGRGDAGVDEFLG